MAVTVDTIMQLIEEIAPMQLAETWDNVGLQVGARDWPVRRVAVALDPTLAVVRTVCQNRIDLLITHHPLIFKPLKAVIVSSPIGQIIQTALDQHLAIACAHTNLDSAAGGLNDQLAEIIGLEDLSVLSPPASGLADPGQPPQTLLGLGRIGRLEPALPLADLAALIKARLKLEQLRYAGDPALQVGRAALCTGSGGGLMDAFWASGAEVFISGDLRYHDARAVEEAGRGLIDVGHFASEHIVVPALADRLRRLCRERDHAVDVVPCELEKDPFKIV